MGHWQERTELLVGSEGLDKLAKAHVLVIGVGGVGGFAAEAVGRAGVGKITLVDGDVIEQSNRNRQIAALISTDGMPKAEVIGNRIKDVNPNVELDVKKIYLDRDNIKELLLAEKYDYIIECIDTLVPKMEIITTAIQNKIKIISSMGAGGRVDPTQTKVARLKDTYNCQLAQKIRKRIKEKSIKRKLKVVFSPELIDKSKVKTVEGVMHKASTIGTISYMPAVFGLTCASVALRGILEEDK
ncbi:tRNA threonylcarbamoyladenosine dehydratase [Flammeovirga pacifica]|uniref:tRNA threonylcarbamoyladenosine dehydratase n=1 Tax=Flammeovirga pacifica TaxID=915059 RepID=A0A1S1YZ11_FLAPC|nr:tRNA threonylcarbamoyladenosine dehydratase [Flammeovirga pacifica]OHX66254.1 tRNA threonylcarbamoyladenosine dehydratase [Flammeovirga pacifica]